MLRFPRYSLKLHQKPHTALTFHSLFLPVNYPHSVANSYSKYILNTFAQVTLQSASRTLATQAMLFSVNIHSPAVTAAAVWILKDGIGLFGSVLTGAMINRGFDGDPKRWRFVSILLGQLSNLFSLVTISQPSLFLLLSSLSSTFSRVATSAHLSSRARIYEGFSREANIGDIMRASQTQATVANLLGMSLGLVSGEFLLTLATENFILTVTGVWLPVAAATQLFAYRSCQAVVLNTLNQQRAEILFSSTDILTPEQVARVENFVTSWRKSARVVVNPPLTEEAASREEEMQTRKFLVETTAEAAASTVWFAVDATPEQVARGLYEALHRASVSDTQWQEKLGKWREAGWNVEAVSFIDDKRFRVHCS